MAEARVRLLPGADALAERGAQAVFAHMHPGKIRALKNLARRETRLQTLRYNSETGSRAKKPQSLPGN